MHELINWLVDTIGALGYPGIFLLMAMESSVVPIPSELVMPPAGYLAQQGEMNTLVAILCGTAGSLVGAYANYFAAHYLGRPLVLKYGKYVFITEAKFAKIEAYFRDHGEISTFIGRLLPVVRHLISLPAGLAGMNHVKFSLYTLAGAGIWVTILTYMATSSARTRN
jgi:membrane protein DedA with SNARE-associated domain